MATLIECLTKKGDIDPPGAEDMPPSVDLAPNHAGAFATRESCAYDVQAARETLLSELSAVKNSNTSTNDPYNALLAVGHHPMIGCLAHQAIMAAMAPDVRSP